MNLSKRNSADKKKAVAKSAAWYTLVSFVTKGLGFITIPIFTRVMTTEQFGLFNNFAAWQVILLSVFSLESYATINRARLDLSGKDLQNYQFTLLTSGIGATFLLLILLVFLPAVPEMLTDLDKELLYMMVLYLLFYPAFNMFQMLQRVQYRYRLSAGLSLGVSLLATVLSVALVLYLPDALIGRVVGQYAPFAVVGVGLYFWYWKTGGVFKLAYLKYALPLCVPLVIATLGSQVLLLGCRIVTQHACGADQVAFLSLATTLSQIVLILIKALDNAWTPWLYDCLEANDLGQASKTFRMYVWGIAVVVALVSLLAPELVALLGGDEYGPTVWLVPSFMATCLFGLLANQYVYLETYYKDVRLGGVFTLAFGLANLLLCWLFVELFGFSSIGYANLISNLFLVAAHKVIIKNLGGVDVFSLKVSGLPLLVGVAMVPLSLLLYSLPSSFYRYALIMMIFALCTVGLFNKREMLVRKIKR